MFIKSPPACPAGTILQSVSIAEQSVERALIEAGLPYELAPPDFTFDAARGANPATFYLPTIDVAIEVRGDHKHAIHGDLIYTGEQGYRDLVAMFSSFKHMPSRSRQSRPRPQISGYQPDSVGIGG